MAKCISDSASTLSPLQTLTWCTIPTKKSMHCSPTSMTARSEAGADRERKVGWKVEVGCRAGPPRGGRRRGPGQHLPTAPFPTHNTWSTLAKSQLDKAPATSRASLGGVGSRCVVLGWWWRCPRLGVHKFKRAYCSPSLASGGVGNPWCRLVATISSMSHVSS